MSVGGSMMSVGGSMTHLLLPSLAWLLVSRVASSEPCCETKVVTGKFDQTYRLFVQKVRIISFHPKSVGFQDIHPPDTQQSDIHSQNQFSTLTIGSIWVLGLVLGLGLGLSLSWDVAPGPYRPHLSHPPILSTFIMWNF